MVQIKVKYATDEIPGATSPHAIGFFSTPLEFGEWMRRRYEEHIAGTYHWNNVFEVSFYDSEVPHHPDIG